MSWMQSIADKDSRDAAREKFDEWLEMKESHNDEIKFVERTGDVAVLHVETGKPDTPCMKNHTARDLAGRYNTGSKPVRCIGVGAVDEGVVQLNMLLAELEVD